MNTDLILKLAATIAVAATLTGCGGGSSDSAPPQTPIVPPPTGGIEGSGISFGKINGFGSVIVNGVRFDTSSAVITVDGVAATQADLAVGDVVLIDGTVSADGTSGTAETVSQDHLVEGPITAIGTDSFEVLGQTVRVDGTTLFDDDIVPGSLAGLVVGDFVEVSGFIGANGDVLATRVEKDLAAAELELTGTVSALDTSATRFEINGQGVDYASAVLEDFPASGIANGDRVEVKGNGLDGNGDIAATGVELKDDDFDVDFDDGDDFDLEGAITRFVSASDFDVAGFAVTTGATTEFEHGGVADLALDVRVEVEGEFNVAGVLVADKVEFHRDADLRVDAAVDSVAADSLVMLGITVRIDAGTSFEDSSTADLESFSLADISAGDFLEVRGSEISGASAEIQAASIKREDAGDTSVRGPLQAIAEPAMTILGVTVDTDANTDFEDANDMPITAAQFFAAVSVGTPVEAEGSEVSTTGIVATEVEIEND